MHCSSVFYWRVVYTVQPHPKQSRNCSCWKCLPECCSSCPSCFEVVQCLSRAIRCADYNYFVAIALLQLGKFPLGQDLNLGVLSFLPPSVACFSCSFHPWVWLILLLFSATQISAHCNFEIKVGDKQFWQSLAHIAKATCLKYPLRIGCNRHYFRSLNLLAWTHLSQQSYGSVTMMPSFYSNITYESSVSVYIGYTTALQCIWIMHAGPKGA